MRSYRHESEIHYNRIKTLHPGEFYEMRLKSSPLNSDISYVITIHDSLSPQNQKNKQCVAVTVSYEITQEILFSKQISFNKMCEQLKAARLIAIESAILNPMNIKELAMELSGEINMMRPEGFTDNVSIRLWEDHTPKQIILENEKYLIRDNEDAKISIRQIYFMNNPNVLQCQIRTKLASKTNVANPPKGITYFPIESQDKYKSKGVLQIIDDSLMAGFYERSILCTIFYMDLTKYPKNTIKIMDIGAGFGNVSFYFYKLFKGNCEIDNIEKNKEINELGCKYFGYQNYDSENKVHWLFEEGKNCIEKMAKFNDINVQGNKSKKLNENKYGNRLGYYDLIFNDINDINQKEDIVPPKEFFNDDFLENVKSLLKPFGIYAVNLMSKNYKSFYEAYLQLEKHFPSIFNIPSDGGLCSIFFCFNEKNEIKEYIQKYKVNKDFIDKSSNIIDISVVKLFVNDVLSRVQDMTEEKKKMEDNAKKI